MLNRKNVTAAVGLGSNLGDPIANVERALVLLSRIAPIQRVSSLYKTKPWGVTAQPDFINAVVLLNVSCTAREFLLQLQEIENEMGRTETFHWGPRVIDLDILTFADQNICEPDLVIPHPELNRRAFVIIPLAEIDGRYTEIIKQLPVEDVAGVSRLD